MKLNFTFYSEPKAIQSARFRKIGNFISSYQPKENIDWKAWIKLQAQTQLPENFNILDEPIFISKLHYIFKPLKSFTKHKIRQIEEGIIIYKDTKPDLDSNLNKGLIDALSGIIWTNDSKIVQMNNVSKFYGLIPKIELSIHTNYKGEQNERYY